jgi:hypothetical protein
VQSSKVTLKQLTVRLAELEKQRGKPSHSISQCVEDILSKYGAERESCHGGELNGRYCKEVDGNAFEIIMEITQLLLRKKKVGGGVLDADIVAKCDGFMRVLGKIDAWFASLRQIFPTDEEHARSRTACDKMMIEWRRKGYKIPLKAHTCEHHFYDFIESCGGLGYFDE